MSFVIGFLFFLYYLIICFYVRRWNSTFSRFWMFSGIVLICWHTVKRWIPISMAFMLEGIWLFCWAVTGIVCFRMLLFEKQKIPGDLAYLIVLGAKVDHKRITCSLRLRLETAYEYAFSQKDVKVVVSGGQGRGEDLPEARAMADYLIQRGLEPERIILEDRSGSTRENLRFITDLIPDITEKKTGLVTNSFHIYRSCLISRREGYRKVFPVAAKSEKILFINYMVREVFAVFVLSVKGCRNKH